MPLPGTCVDYLSQISDLRMWQRMYENKIFNPGQCITETDVEKTLRHHMTSSPNSYRQTNRPFTNDHNTRKLKRTCQLREEAASWPIESGDKIGPWCRPQVEEKVQPSISMYPTQNNWKRPAEPEMEYIPMSGQLKKHGGKELLRRPFKRVLVEEAKMVIQRKITSARGRSAATIRKLDALSLQLAKLTTNDNTLSAQNKRAISALPRDAAKQTVANKRALSAAPRDAKTAPSCSHLRDTPSLSDMEIRTPSPFSVEKFRRYSYTTFEDKNPFTPQSYYAQNYPIIMQQIKRRDKSDENEDDQDDEDDFDMYRPIPKTPEISLTMFDELPRMSSSFSDLCVPECDDYGVSKAMSDTAIDMHRTDVNEECL